jgi:prephenate dehydratase
MLLLTDRAVEREILRLFPDPLFLKMIELSKRIQLRCITDLCSAFRTGYLFGPGTFSHEAVRKLKGIHVAYPTYAALMEALALEEVNAVLVPTHNSIIGPILQTNPALVRGTIEHPIQLCVYSNREETSGPYCTETLYIEPHIYEECKLYIQKNIRPANVVPVSNTKAGCLALLRDEHSALTIASLQNKSNFMYTLAENIVDHNITTFSFLMKKTQSHPTFPSIDACIDVHYR